MSNLSYCPKCESPSVEIAWMGGYYECLWRDCGWRGKERPDFIPKPKYYKWFKSIKSNN